MRIAFILNSFPNLSETFILNQITGLIDRGHEVDIYAFKRGDVSKVHKSVTEYDLLEKTHYSPQFPVKYFRRFVKAIWLVLSNFHKKPAAIIDSLNIFRWGMKAASLRILYRVIPFLDAPSYDIIHCHFGPNGVLGSRLRELGVIEGKLISTFHGFDISKLLSFEGDSYYRELFRKGDLFLPISETWRKKLITLGCPQEKIKVHHMGIRPEWFSQMHRGLSQNVRINILSIARLVEKKGIEYGIRAAADLKRKGFFVRYMIAGQGTLRKKLEALVKDLSLRDTVEFLGSKNTGEIKKLLEESDIFLAPSITASNGDQEGIPVSIMEAMATGLPVVSTQHSGIPELVKDGKTGFLVLEKDVDALADRLEYLIEHPEVWPKMGKEGRKYVEANFDIDKLNDRLVEIYQELLNG